MNSLKMIYNRSIKMYLFVSIVIWCCDKSIGAQIPFFLTGDNKFIDSKLFDSSTDPLCQNFYEHACSKWKSEAKKPDFELSWSHFTAASYNLKTKIHKILVTPVNKLEQPFLHKAQTFYNACVNFSEHEAEYLTDLRALIKYFNGWPIVEENWVAEGYHWLNQVVEITRNLGVSPFIKFHVGVDYKDTERYILYIDPGNLIFPSNVLLNPAQFSKELEAYHNWIFDTIKYMYPDANLTSDIQEIIRLEQNIAHLGTLKSKMERNSLDYFTRKFGVDFYRIVTMLFEHLGLTLSDTVVIKNSIYFKRLVGFLNRTDKRVIANYLIWTIVKEFSRDTTNYLKKINFSIDKTVLGFEKDVSRHLECTNEAIDHFSYAILPTYLDLYMKNDMFQSVEVMAQNIKSEFVNLLMHNTWLSSKTKYLAIEKVRKIQVMVGYIDWMTNSSYLEGIYDKINISNHHFKNLILLKQAKIKRNLLLIGENVTTPQWPFNIFDVNAYYSTLQNLVFVPLGIIQEPFYDQKAQRIFNYAALGSLIGHEFSHSLDTTGRQANANGKIIKWWPNKDVINYQQRSRCFRNNGNDSLSMGENIADNVGLHVSFKAFKNSRRFELEDVFKGPEDDRVFFLAYAQMWCEISKHQEVFTDEHASVEVRVNHAVQNNKYFSEMFKCDKNELRFCKLW